MFYMKRFSNRRIAVICIVMILFLLLHLFLAIISPASNSVLLGFILNKNYSALESALNENPKLANEKTRLKQPVIYVAAQQNDIIAARILLKHGADINSPWVLGRNILDGFTPLHIAYYMEHHEMVDFLIANGASTDVRDFSGTLPKDAIKKKSQR